MSRVSTYGNYQSTLMNLMAAQQRGQKAQAQLSSGKLGASFTDFGRTSETITALRTTQTRISGFLETSKATADRLTTQDLALERIASSTTDARMAIGNALAAGRAEGLMTELGALFQAVQDGINTKHQGKYIFSGGAIETRPTSVTNLDALADESAVGAIFQNDNLIQTSWVDENITLETGFLAREVGEEIYGIFQEIAAFNRAEPLTSTLTDTQQTFLTEIMDRLDRAAKAVVTNQATNGAVLSRTESIIESHTRRGDALEVMLGGKTDADMAKVVTELEMSELAIQAAAQVVSRLRQVSLLDYLR